ALKKLNNIWEKYPDSELVPKSLLKMGEILVEAKRVNEGLRKFEELVYSYPNSPFARMAHKRAGEALKARKSYHMAIAHFEKAMTGEDSEMNAEIQFYIALCVEEKGDLKDAVVKYLKVAYLYPSGKYWGIKAQFRCAQLFEKDNEIEKAEKIYERLADEPVEEGAYARGRLAWLKGQKK
ncbi:MAG: tetratricopeptide repeat protein, partial [Candidatus Omnitrophota bacterium]|nr:tetratricopeptide repeat protein [Candidatus Omnitrophota bacterium]